jgi:peptide/nickel transport system substrate-binding protein
MGMRGTAWAVAGAVLIASAASGSKAAGCPWVTVADDRGITGRYPQQFELAEFQEMAGCELSFQENPSIADLNARIEGNPSALPPVAERLPAEPLVVAPYHEIGHHGGAFVGLSNSTESGTADLLSIRHVNLVRYADDLETIVPNIAKGWRWNEDFTELTVQLRDGHKWSDGEPFTAVDVVFWYEDLILNPEIYPETPDRWLFASEAMDIEAVDATTVKMSFPVPAPGILNRFAVDYAQPFQPKHFYKSMHAKYNPNADELAAERGFESWVELVNNYYGGSDYKDVPSPLLKGTDDRVAPTLESHILIEETASGRRYVANPYFHMVDTAGSQLPYIDQIDEHYVPDKEVQNLKIVNREVTYRQQGIFLEDYPLLKANEDAGGYKIELVPELGEEVYYSFNRTHKDPVLREIFSDRYFNQAMSLALDREEINEIVYLGQGEPMQATPADPSTVSFVTEEHTSAFIDHDPDRANALLDAVGLVDGDGDGVRERPDGKPLAVRLIYSSLGAPVQMQELVRDYWGAVGVRVDLKEVSADEYRADASNNDLDLTVWRGGVGVAPTIAQDVIAFVPPFGDYWRPGTGFAWAVWRRTGGTEGIEPPDDVKTLFELAEQFVRVPLGSEQSNRIGTEIVDIHVTNLWKIGTVGNVVGAVMHRDDLRNIGTFTAKSGAYWRTYPFRPPQWYLAR